MDQKLIELIRKACGTDVEVTRDTNFIFDLGLKSIDLLEFVTDIEDAYGIEVTDEAIEEIKTVGDLIDYIEKAKK